VKNHPSIRITGASVHWGIDNSEELENWGPRIRLDDDKYFASRKEIEKINFATRLHLR
jgi:hypothetical protein